MPFLTTSAAAFLAASAVAVGLPPTSHAAQPIPAGAVTQDPYEIDAASRSCAEQAFPKLIHCNRLDKGGHLVVWEPPELFVQEVRTAFKPLH